MQSGGKVFDVKKYTFYILFPNSKSLKSSNNCIIVISILLYYYLKKKDGSRMSECDIWQFYEFRETIPVKAKL